MPYWAPHPHGGKNWALDTLLGAPPPRRQKQGPGYCTGLPTPMATAAEENKGALVDSPAARARAGPQAPSRAPPAAAAHAAAAEGRSAPRAPSRAPLPRRRRRGAPRPGRAPLRPLGRPPRTHWRRWGHTRRQWGSRPDRQKIIPYIRCAC